MTGEVSPETPSVAPLRLPVTSGSSAMPAIAVIPGLTRNLLLPNC